MGINMKKITEPLIRIMTEEEIKNEFLPNLKTNTYELFIVLEEVIRLKKYPTREMVFATMKEVEGIETFLDDYGAAHNKRFFYFRELIASMRWINIVIFHGLHILARIESYRIEVSKSEKKLFIERLRRVINRCLTDVKTLSKELFNEGLKVGIKKPRAKFTEKKYFADIQKKILPPDINVVVVKTTEELTIDILVKFLENSEIFNSFFCQQGFEIQYTEETLERHRSVFNTLESLYDTYLHNTEIENRYSDLRSVRSCIAITLHLLEMAKALAHFYERHGEKIRSIKPSLKDAKFANKKEIGFTMKNFLIFYSIFFLNRGKEFSAKIFKDMGKQADEFIYTTKILHLQAHRLEDFHIRPIMPVTQIANKYKLDTYLYHNRNKYNLKSAIEMALAIPDIRDDLQKGHIEIMVQGPKKAVQEIASFFNERCGALAKEIVCDVSPSK